jgi:hypothetical protein
VDVLYSHQLYDIVTKSIPAEMAANFFETHEVDRALWLAVNFECVTERKIVKNHIKSQSVDNIQ